MRIRKKKWSDKVKPEWHIENPKEGCFISGRECAELNNRYIHISISKEDLGNLLQGKHLGILFLDDNYRNTGMIDVQLSDSETNFVTSEKVNDFMIQGRHE